MIKKIAAVVLALTMTMCTMTACGSAKDSSSSSSSKTSSSSSSSTDSTATSSTTKVADPSLTIDGKKIDTKNFTMCTIDGTKIDFDTFRYYYFYTINKYTQTYGATLDTIASASGGFEALMKDVVNNIKQELVTPKLAKENSIELTSDDEKTVESKITSAKANYSTTAAYQADLKTAYLTEALYKKMLESAQLYTKVNDKLFKNDGKYATKKADFKKIVQDTSKYCREVHIMIPYYSQVDLDSSTAASYDTLSLSDKASAKQSAFTNLSDAKQKTAKAKAKKLAQEILKKAQTTSDFGKLIEQYGWDVGLETDTSTGYYFNKDTTGYPTELVKEAFALKENQVSSKVIENTTYGYFIVKRLKVDMTYVNKNIVDMIYSYDTPTITSIYTKYMNNMKITYCDNWSKISKDSIT